MSRLPPISAETLTPEQRAVYDAITSGPRGAMGLVGPFGVYVRAPRVGNAAQALGATVRFETDLPEDLKEVAILTVGAFFRSRFEFSAHARLGRKAGVPDGVIEALRKGESPRFEREDERLVHELTSQLLARHRIDDATYAAAERELGQTQLIELVTVIGYYTLVSFTLNAFDVPLADGMEDPFPEA